VWFRESWYRPDVTAVSAYHCENGISEFLIVILSMDTALSPAFLIFAAPQAKPSSAVVCTHILIPDAVIDSCCVRSERDWYHTKPHQLQVLLMQLI